MTIKEAYEKTHEAHPGKLKAILDMDGYYGFGILRENGKHHTHGDLFKVKKETGEISVLNPASDYDWKLYDRAKRIDLSVCLE